MLFTERYFNIDNLKQNKWILGYILIAIICSYFTAISSTGTDFDAYLEAANKFKLRENIYSAPYPNYERQYFYSVFFAWIVSLFSDFSKISQFVWAFISFGLLYRIFLFLYESLEIAKLSDKKRKLWILLLFILALNTISQNISRNQVNVFILWGILESYRLCNQKKYVLAASILGFCLNLKLIPLVVLPFFIYKKHFQFLAFIPVVLAFFYLFPAVILGWNLNMEWIETWYHIVNPLNHEHIVELNSPGLVSLSSFLSYYFIQSDSYQGHLSHFFALDLKEVSYLLTTLRMLLIALGIYLLRPKDIKIQSWGDLRGLFYFCLLIPLLFPHQHKYALIAVIPAIAYCLGYFIVRYGHYTTLDKIAITLFCIAMIAFSPINGSDVIGVNLFVRLQEFKTFTLSVLVLIPILIYCRPEGINFKN